MSRCDLGRAALARARARTCGRGRQRLLGARYSAARRRKRGRRRGGVVGRWRGCRLSLLAAALSFLGPFRGRLGGGSGGGGSGGRRRGLGGRKCGLGLGGRRRGGRLLGFVRTIRRLGENLNSCRERRKRKSQLAKPEKMNTVVNLPSTSGFERFVRGISRRKKDNSQMKKWESLKPRWNDCRSNGQYNHRTSDKTQKCICVLS